MTAYARPCVWEDLPQDTPWFKWDYVQTATDKCDTNPLEELCLKCGTAVDAYPGQDRQALLQRAVRDRRFRGELLIMSEIQGGLRARDFRPSIVHLRHHMGIRLEARVAIVEVDVFAAKCGMPPGPAVSTAAANQVIDFITEEGVECRGVVVALANLPEEIPYREASMYYQAETMMAALVLRDANQLRQEQASETFAWTGQQLLKDRGAPLRSNNALKLWTWQGWQERVGSVQAKRQSAEADGGDDDESDGGQDARVSKASNNAAPLTLRVNMGGVGSKKPVPKTKAASRKRLWDSMPAPSSTTASSPAMPAPTPVKGRALGSVSACSSRYIFPNEKSLRAGDCHNSIIFDDSASVGPSRIGTGRPGIPAASGGRNHIPQELDIIGLVKGGKLGRTLTPARSSVAISGPHMLSLLSFAFCGRGRLVKTA